MKGKRQLINDMVEARKQSQKEGYEQGYIDAMRDRKEIIEYRNVELLINALKDIVGITDNRVPSGVGYNCRMIALNALEKYKGEEDERNKI